MNHEPIAIIGLGCRFPGARDTRAFWKLLSGGVDAITTVPPERWDIGAFYDPDPAAQGKMSTRWGGFLEQVDGFDPLFFKIAPREVASMDPQQRLLLEVTWEALEDAGQVPELLAGTQTGVFVGISSYDYCTILCRDTRNVDAHIGTGNTNCIAANRISYLFDFHGPSLAIDTACSSSLVAVHLGCKSLWTGESTLVIAGGVQLVLSPWATVGYSKAGSMSPDGRCKAFDASADGYVRSEGAGVVILKPLAKALADGDPIYAVIRGSAINQDGRSNGLTAPSPAAQAAVIQEAYRQANIAPSAVQYVEAHGTGTRLGDPIEMKSLAAAVGQGRPPGNYCAVGSVKTNIGHLEAAAGIAGLIKVALSLKHRQIPPSLHFKVPNPYIPFDKLPLRVQETLQPWPEGPGPALAGVSSFGFGGTNAHVVLEGAPALQPSEDAGAGMVMVRPQHILMLRAKSESSLRELARRYHDLLVEQPEVAIGDVCYSANTGRSSFPHRLAVIAGSAAELGERLDAFAQNQSAPSTAYAEVVSRKRPRVAFLFTGLGAQYVGMGQQLYESQPTFRAALDRCDAILRGHLDRPLLSMIYPPPGLSTGQDPPLGENGASTQIARPRRTFLQPSRSSLLDETAYAQPALFALEYALAELWRSWAVEPAVVLGHSVGELAAACVAGVFSLEEGLRLVAERARLMQALPGDGTMVAVLAPEARVAAAIEDHGKGVSIAAINGPENVVISGPSDALRAVVAALEGEDVKVQPLRVSRAFHSSLIEPMLDDFEQAARSISLHAPRIPLVSNVTGEVLPAGEVPDAAYWRRHTRAPVKFLAGIQALYAQGCELLLEIGPTPVLTYLGSQCLPEAQVRWLPSLVERQSDWSVMLGSLSALCLGGVEVDWRGFDKDYARERLSLPNYPFERKRYWFTEGAPLVTEPVPAIIERVLPASESAPSTSEQRLAISERLAGGDVPKAEVSVVPSTARRNAIVSALSSMFAEALRAEPSEVAPQVPLMEMGADSFTLVEVVQQIEAKYKQEISLRQLFEELNTIEALANHIEQHLPPEPVASQQVEPQPGVPQGAAPSRGGRGGELNEPMLPVSGRSVRGDVPRPQGSVVSTSARRDAVVSALRSMVADMLRAAPSEVPLYVTFLDMGADSTTLIEVIRLIDASYHQKISIRQLFEDLSTIDALANHIEQHLPPESAAPQQVVPQQVVPQQAALHRVGPGELPFASPPVPQVAPIERALPVTMAPGGMVGGSAAESALERIFSQQLEILSKQLDVLGSRRMEDVAPLGAANGTSRGPAPEAPVPLPSPRAAVRPVVESRREAAPVVPPAPPENHPTSPASAPAAADRGEMNPQQLRHLQSLTERYTRRTGRSKQWAQAHRPALADSRGVAGFRMAVKEISYPIVGSRYRGARIWDIDGNEYVDIAMGFGVHLFGHGAPFIQQAITEQLERGFGIGPQAEGAGELAELFVEMTGADRVTFCQSGSEAVMTSLRLARTATRREKIALFKGSFHGHFDGVLAQGRGSDQPSLPAAPGVSAGAVRDVVVLDYGEPSALEYIQRHAHELAAVLVEPVQSRRPDLQPRAFLHELRAITEAAGTALIFDEIITGFRVHPGGAQAFFGVRADLATYGKIPGGGLPLAAVAGKRRFMDGIDGGAWSYGDLSQPQAERTFFAGTFNKPPMSLATALAVLRHLKERGPRLQEELNERTTRLAATLNDFFEKEEVPARIVHFGSLFRFVLKGNLELFFHHLIDQGVYVWEGRSCFLSTAHTEADVEHVIQAVRHSMEKLREGGFLPEGPPGRPRSDRGSEPARRAPPPPLEPRSVAPAAAGVAMAGGPASGSASQGLTTLGRTREDTQQPTEYWERRRRKVPPAERGGKGETRRGASRWCRAREDLEFSLYYFGKYEAAFRDDKYDLLFDGARFADEHGFTAIWVPERHFHPFGGFSPNPSVVCAALARETKRLQLRAGSVVVPLHHPVRIAEEWAVVDNLSKGRVGLSFASGWHPDDFVFAPDAYGKHRELMFQGIETIRKLWRGETIRMRAGDKNEVSAGCFPLPMQRELPTWVTIVNNADTYVRAGEIGAGVLTNLMGQTLEDLAGNIDLYREAIERSGRDPASGHVTVLLHTFVGEDFEATRDKARKPFCDYLDSHFSLFQNVAKSQNLPIDLDKLAADDRQYMLSMAYERYARTSALVGTPESCEVIIDHLREMGIDEVACFVDFGMDARSVLDSLPSLCALKDRYRHGGGSTMRKGAPDQPGVSAIERIESQAPKAALPAVAPLPLPAPQTPVAGPDSGDSEEGLVFPMTLAQREALTLVKLAETDTAIGASVCLDLRGPLRLDALRRALQQVTSRHEALHTTLTPEQDAVRISKPGTVPVDITDLSGSQGDDLEHAATAWLREAGRRGFDLVEGPVFRASLATMGEHRHLLLLATHHILCDGWSIGIIVDELSELYTANCEGRTCHLPEPLQFREYVARQEALRGTQEMAAHERYWLEQFAGEIPQLDLPTDRPRPAVKTYRARRLTHRLEATVCQDLRRVAREHGCTFFMLNLAAYMLLLHRVSGQDSLVIGTPVAGQVGERDRALVGHCANLLPIRSNLRGGDRFSDLLLRTKRVLLEAFEHREYSFHLLVTLLPLPRDPSRIPLVSVAFNMDRAPPKMMGLETGYWRSQPIDFALSETSLNITEVNDGLVIDWNYNEDLFDRETVERWRAHYEALLDGIVAAPGQLLSEMSILPKAERHQLLVEWNNTRIGFFEDACVHELFEQQATRTPQALAVSCGPRQLTFGELSRRASQLAHHLRSLGVGRETRVALYLERSVEMIVSLLAILEAGGAYVPLDPGHPAERLALILSDSQASLLLTTSDLVAGLTFPASVRALHLDQLELTLSALPATPPAATATPDNAAYVLYTSGSTGQPRGVVVQHRSVVNLLGALRDAVYSRHAGRPLRVSVNGSIAFDTSVKQIIQLLHGHALDIIPERLRVDGAALRDYLHERSIDVLDCTPSQLRLLLASGFLEAPGGPCCVLVGGEALDDALWQELSRSDIEFFNVYGPTECTVDTTVCRVQPLHPRPVLGGPLANVRVYVLDRDLQLCPVGVPGELFISGAGVARGYLEDPALTAERFLPDPFSEEPGVRMYRTGDKARFLPSGNVEFLGRLDYQVKVRGFRIELSEVEAALSRLPAVQASVVVVHEGVPGDKRLVAYFVPRDAQSVPTSQQLHRALHGSLPEYMLPSAFVALEALPLTPNGKVDRNVLPAPDAAVLGAADLYVAPRTPTEELLTSIWSDVLRGAQGAEIRDGAPGVPPISVTANFFHLGGNSLLGVRILDEIQRRMGQTLRIQDLFEEPTIEHLAEVIQRYGSWAGKVLGQESRTMPKDQERKILVKIRTNGKLAPLFFVPPLGGVFPSTVAAGILDIAKHLDSEQPFYGLQIPALTPEMAESTLFPPLDDWQYDRSRINRIVANCIALMEEVHPGGPYFLGGYCTGSLLALEIAGQLQRLEGLILIDPRVDAPEIEPANGNSTLTNGLEPRLAAMSLFVARDIAWHAGYDLDAQVVYDALKALPPEQRWDEARDRLVAAGCLPASTTSRSVRRVFELKEINGWVVDHVLRTFKPRQYSGPVAMLFSEQITQGASDETITESMRHIRKYMVGALEVHYIKGDHDTVFREPNIRVLMEHMNRYLIQNRRA